MRLPIATAFDVNYVQHVGTMLSSLFLTNPHELFHIHLFHHHADSTNLNKIIDHIQKYDQTVSHYDVSLGDVNKYTVNGHISLATYLRVFIPAYIESSLEKILYLDADIIVNGALSPLWQIDISDFCLGAVESVTMDEKDVMSEIGNYRYFNAGVLLINLKKWRERHVMEKTINFIENHKNQLKFWDQDALNAVLYDQWLSLHPKYNMQGALFMDEFDGFRGDPQQLLEAINDPVIIHYSTPQKPWHYLSFHPYTYAYYKYLAHTPWKDYQPTDKSLVRVVRKRLRPYLRKMGIRKVFGKHLY